MSALARLFHARGDIVTGSDREASRTIDALASEGIAVSIGHVAELVRGADMVVYTKALGEDNTELAEARRLGLPLRTYSEALGEFSKEKYTIAVAGAHGKTTTTGMTGKLLSDAGLAPTIIVGGEMANFGTNFVAGTGGYLVVEADEYRESFLDLHPRMSVITNIDNDHLDYYKDIAAIQGAFKKFVRLLPEGGSLVCNPTDVNVAAVLTDIEDAGVKVVDYTLSPRDFRLKVPGEHNIRNAQAAYTVGVILGIPAETIRKSLESFSGTRRRIELKGVTASGTIVYDDYAHHPTEIKATLAALRGKHPEKKIFAVFQPHLFSRTKLLLADFAVSFADADEVIFAPIYAAREENTWGVSSEALAREAQAYHKHVRALSSFGEIEGVLKKEADSHDLIVTLGAGDIFKVGEDIIEKR